MVTDILDDVRVFPLYSTLALLKFGSSECEWC